MSKKSERGGALTMVLVCIIIILSTAIVTAVIVALLDKEQYTESSPAFVPSKPKDTTADDERIRLNNLRKSEAAILSDSVYKYYTKNQNQYPTGFSAGQLTGEGTPEPVKLTYFKQVLVVSGTQQPLADDAVRVVTKSICAPSGAGTSGDTARRYAYAVQYTAQNPDGTLQAKCHQP